jgi:NTE family protein
MSTPNDVVICERALVLGGGGPVGIAWEAGLAAGLAAEGVRVGDADRIIGTSAGSFVGAQLASGRDAKSLYEAQIALGEKDAAERAEGKPASAERMPKPDLGPLMALFLKPLEDGETAEDRRRAMGALALKTETISEQAFVDGFGRSLSDLAWPERFACTAVDAETGAFRLWTAGDRVPLAAGVGSSCSVPGIFPPITIHGRRYIDGGVRSATCIDTAKGAKRVLAIAVVGRMGREMQLARIQPELDALAPEGQGLLITPDEASLDVFGVNLMEAKDRAAIARAGYAQGQREAERIRPFWS